jgi:hypothetical protein
MAAAAIGLALPAIEALAPSIINLITGLVHKAAPAAEAANGPSTGPVKFGQVFTDVVAALNSAAAAGQIAKTLPSDPAIQIIIQAVVTSMQLNGQLASPAATPAANPSVSVSPGSGVTISSSGLIPGYGVTINGSSSIPSPLSPVVLKAGQSITITVA